MTAEAGSNSKKGVFRQTLIRGGWFRSRNIAAAYEDSALPGAKPAPFVQRRRSEGGKERDPDSRGGGGGQRGELRMKGVPRMRFAIRRALPPLDRLRGFSVVRKARRVEVQLVFARPLPEVRTGVPERLVGLDAGIRTFAMLLGGGSLQRRPRQGGA